MRRPRSPALVLALAAALAAAGCGEEDPGPRAAGGARPLATVFAASSLRDAFPAIAPARFGFDGSGALQLQVERGAPADVFASASPREAEALHAAGRCSRPRTFATNGVVLLVPRRDPAGIRSLRDLRAGGLRLAVGADGVPVGDYTRSLLERMGLGAVLVRNRVSRETDAASIVAKVALGSADAGFAYATDARIAADRVRAIALPRAAQPPVEYRICAIRRAGADADGARRFIDAVVSARGRAILREHGFGLPPR